MERSRCYSTPPAGIRQDIIERTDGIPLFVEEMTKAVLDAEGESEAQRAVPEVLRHGGRLCRRSILRNRPGSVSSVADITASAPLRMILNRLKAGGVAVTQRGLRGSPPGCSSISILRIAATSCSSTPARWGSKASCRSGWARATLRSHQRRAQVQEPGNARGGLAPGCLCSAVLLVGW